MIDKRILFVPIALLVGVCFVACTNSADNAQSDDTGTVVAAIKTASPHPTPVPTATPIHRSKYYGVGQTNTTGDGIAVTLDNASYTTIGDYNLEIDVTAHNNSNEDYTPCDCDFFVVDSQGQKTEAVEDGTSWDALSTSITVGGNSSNTLYFNVPGDDTTDLIEYSPPWNGTFTWQIWKD